MWLTVAVGDTQEPKELTKPTPAPVAARAPASSLTSEQIIERLRYLEKLYQEGILSEEEYRRVRSRLLSGK
jgi:hypothetical protein